jgi:UDP:flavonoid glycosyltransferase YjiC (YdhE family)
MMLPSLVSIPDDVEKFINDGKPPIYIGFGSIPVSQPERFSKIFCEVSDVTSQRLIISKGWADLPVNNTSNILYVGEMPFDLLFPRMAAIVHNGGAGTMAAAARAGIPQVALPFMADQFENRKQIVKLGIGPNTCDFKKISAQALSMAITNCISNINYKKTAKEISQKLSQTNGLEMTVNHIEGIIKNQAL